MVLLIPVFIDLYMIFFKFIVIIDKLKAMLLCLFVSERPFLISLLVDYYIFV